MKTRKKKIHVADKIDMELLSQANAFSVIDYADPEPKPCRIAGGFAAAKAIALNPPAHARQLVYGWQEKSESHWGGQVLLTKPLLELYDREYGHAGAEAAPV